MVTVDKHGVAAAEGRPRVVTATEVRPRVRLEYLDGLRGLAACYVALGHIYVALVFFSRDVVLPHGLTRVLSLFNIGQTAVDIFIVLSGYCLMLPAVRARGELKGGLWAYFGRRARRIIPPYYAAIVVSLALAWIALTRGWPDSGLPLPSGALVSHLLLIHNFSKSWIHAIDPPMWSVAVEWQIYFFLPFVLLPIWRRFGPFASVLVGLGLGLAPHFIVPASDFSFPWFLGLFSLGTWGATINFSDDERSKWLLEKVPWGWLSLAIWFSVLAFLATNRGWYSHHQWIADPALGLATMSLLIHCSRPRPGDQSLVLRILSSRLAVWLGSFSYSLYLIHYPVMTFLWSATIGLAMSATSRAGLMYGVGFPLMLVASFVFHLAFERPFMRSKA